MTFPLKNDLLLRALLKEPTPRRPIWLMRQAGRYLPEYRATRTRAGSFMALCTNPQLACEVTLQPIDRFPLDAAILFSDILTIPHAMNLGLEFEAGGGPTLDRPVRSAADVANLKVPDPAHELRYVIDAVALIRRELAGRVPLIGFAGSPWTVATYMVEGGGSKTFGLIKRMMYESPEVLHRLLDVLARSTILYLNAQIAAGAQAVMVFDTWGGVLTPAQYEEFSLRYMAQVIGELTRESGGSRVPTSCSPRAAAPGSERSRRSAATPSASIGPPISRRPAKLSGAGSPCRATWTRRRCSPHRRRCAPKLVVCSIATVPDRGTSSIWVTASRRTSTRNVLRCWWIQCATTWRRSGRW